MQFAITEHFVDIALPLSSTFVSYILYKYSLVGYKNQADRSKKVENLQKIYETHKFSTILQIMATTKRMFLRYFCDFLLRIFVEIYTFAQ